MAASSAAADLNLDTLREGMKDIIKNTLEKVVQGAWASPHATGNVALTAITEDHITRLERAAYNSSVRTARAQPKLQHRQHYVSTIRAMNVTLGCHMGPYPDDVAGVMFLRGSVTPNALAEYSNREYDDPDPREIIKRMLVRTLMEADVRYADGRELALDTARAIEVSCYNAAVRISKDSEDPPRRQWDSPAFVDTYSTRCGTIACLLNAESSVCRAYGATLVPRLLDGSISPESLGDMTSESLCPQATATERAEIAKRVVQKVEMKESTLFRCPHCREWRCAYQEVQRRSLDESPDYLCLCLNCNRRFTGRN